MDLGNALASKRIGVGLRQGDVAVKVGVARQFLCDVEHGRRSVSLSMLQSLCDLYGVADQERHRWFCGIGRGVGEAYRLGRKEAVMDAATWVYGEDLVSVLALAKEWAVTEREAVARLVRSGLAAERKEGF